MYFRTMQDKIDVDAPELTFQSASDPIEQSVKEAAQESGEMFNGDRS